jgi:hypothetical protein
MFKNPPCLLLTAAAFLAGAGHGAAATTYTYAPIIVPGALQTNPAALNASGTVTGVWYDQEFNSHGFFYKAGKITTFDYPKSQGTTPYGINSAGEIVGTYLDASYTQHGFTYRLTTGGKAVFTSVDFPGTTRGTGLDAIDTKGILYGVSYDSSGSQEIFGLTNKAFTTLVDGNTPVPLGFSDNGAFAGYFAGAVFGDPTTAFVFQNATLTTLPLPKGATQAAAYWVNDRGVVVGESQSASGTYSGFEYSAGKITSVNKPGAVSTLLKGINYSGVVVGIAYDANYNTTSFTYSGGKFTAIAMPGGADTSAQAINLKGMITGTYYDANGQETFLATPQ